MQKKLKKIGIPVLTVALLAVVYLLGPAPEGLPQPSPNMWQPSAIPLQALEAQIVEKEARMSGLKPGNAAKIVWANPSQRQKTPYALVYLHGFSASHYEGHPLCEQVAEYYGCNLYLSRLAGHGLSGDSIFQNLTPGQYIESAVEALRIGKQLGEKVILIGTSTGGALSLYLAALDTTVEAVVLNSPLIDFYDPLVNLLSLPWGLSIGRTLMGSEWVEWEPKNPEQHKYWSTRYRLEGVAALSKMANETMQPETFSKVQCPIMLNYYYESEAKQDSTVSVAAMLKMYEQLGTPGKLKKRVAYPNANSHVITCHLTSDAWEAVRDSTLYFLGHTVGLSPTDELPDVLLQESLE